MCIYIYAYIYKAPVAILVVVRVRLGAVGSGFLASRQLHDHSIVCLRPLRSTFFHRNQAFAVAGVPLRRAGSVRTHDGRDLAPLC